MATTRSEPSTTTPGPTVVLAEVRSSTERRLIAAWAAREHPGTKVIEADDPALGERLQHGDDPLVTPVRVTWLPPGGSGRRTSPSGLMQLATPRRPPGLLQPLIARGSSERHRVVAGAPAHALDLQRRFREEEGGGGRAAFASFVRRQATIATDRAERGIIGDRYKVPRLVAEQIGASAAFRAQVNELAEEMERPAGEVLEEAIGCLDELATVQSPLAIDAYRAFLRPLHARAWTVEADWAALERLREANKKHALVFLPSHRSYVDPLVLQDVLHQAEFPRNHLLGGDNMSFWPLGMLGRRAGLVFIRRSFGNDRVYRLAVKAFFGHLVGKRFNLEWYVEGGRSRTGKLRPPRVGLLHYLTAAIKEGRADDVLLVPTSIVYDRLHEVGDMTAEGHGKAKQSEGLKWWVDYVRAQGSENGTARVDFGEPFSLRGALDEAGDGSAQLEKVAFRICDGINRVTPVTRTSLVTLALLGVRDRALTLEEVGRVTAPLLDLFAARGTPGHLEELRRPKGLLAGLDVLQGAGVVERFDGGTEPVWQVAAGGHQIAAFYRNGALHHLLLRATVELALLQLASTEVEGDLIEAAWEDALRTRDLLKFEFFFPDKATFREELGRELDLMAPNWRDRAVTRSGAADLLAGSQALVAHRALRSFLDAQLVVSCHLAGREPRKAIEKDTFLDECMGIGRQWVLQGRLYSEEAVSRELFSAALRLAANRDLVDPGREDVRRGREAWRDEVRDVVARLETIGGLDRASLEEVLGHGA